VRGGVGARAVAVYVRGEDALDRSERGVAVVEERGRTSGEERASPVEDDEALAAELRREGREVVRVVRDEGVDNAGGGEVGALELARDALGPTALDADRDERDVARGVRRAPALELRRGRPASASPGVVEVHDRGDAGAKEAPERRANGRRAGRTHQVDAEVRARLASERHGGREARSRGARAAGSVRWTALEGRGTRRGTRKRACAL
jgi:hypothetical protein